MNDPTDLHGAEDREALDALKDKEALKREVKEFKDLMATAAGRRFVYGLLAKAGVYRQAFTTNGALTNFNEGRRSVGLEYLAMINDHCLNEFVLMLQEHNAS